MARTAERREKSQDSHVVKADVRQETCLLSEVPEEILRQNGWKYCDRTDGHVFRIFIPQLVDIQKALNEGKFVYTQHQYAQHLLNRMNERDQLRFSKHLDHLIMLRPEGIMVTDYNPEIPHRSITVLEKIKE